MALCTDESVSVPELATSAESRGFHSLYLGEHTHQPVAMASQYPMGTPPTGMRRMVDPLIALAAAATVTTTIELGTAVMLPAQHDALVCAKQVATLDFISRGRVVLGVGFGWNDEEMMNHGVNPKRRRAALREHMLAMEALWREESAAAEGERVSFSEAWQWPKPWMRERPTVLMGAAPGPNTYQHIAEYCDGWMPVAGSDLPRQLPLLRRAFEDAGRDPDSLEVCVLGCPPVPKALDRYASLGVQRVIFPLPILERGKTIDTVSRDDAERAMDQLQELLTHVSP
ncbi:TIGR03619 family F420-dependent LLM class oxidoreductase [Longivirga aurantiaca]|uniref:TIGR03619 family F420-dependent LLM class oxidoreductase n=1 Tax=Longivirga aurantiaca TaxID=1837743 RepID=A0ABW1T4Q6_9ACTN